MIDSILDNIGGRIRGGLAEWFTVDWFWWDYALFLAPIVGVWLLLLWLVRFMPDGAKPYALAALTFGLGAAWAYWKRRQDELKRKPRPPPPPPKPKPPTFPTWPPFGR